jgi:hypothetical protein
LGQDDAVDPDQVARGVDERPARVARIDRGVRLDEILEPVDAEVVAAKGAHDAERDGVAEVERVADREHEVADLHPVERRERDRRKFSPSTLMHREIRFGIGPADRALVRRPSANTSWMSSAPSIT